MQFCITRKEGPIAPSPTREQGAILVFWAHPTFSTTKAGAARGRLRRPVARPGCGPVNKFPARLQADAPPHSGLPPPHRTRKPAVPAGHENGRFAACTKKGGASSPSEPRTGSSFVTGRWPVSCPAKRVFVSGGSGGDATHRKGRGWRRPCSHGTARSPAREAANGGPPRRRISWSRVAQTGQWRSSPPDCRCGSSPETHPRGYPRAWFDMAFARCSTGA